MKKYIFLLLMLITTNVFAKDNTFTSSVSFVGMSMDYKEYAMDGELLDSEESSYSDITGAEMSIGYMLSQDISSSSEVKFNFMILGGETKYTGSYIGSGLGYGSVVSTTQNTIIDTDISYKRKNIFKNSLELSYGIGLGYREWERALSASQIEVYSWYSIRPTIGIGTTIKEKFNLGISVEYQQGFDTKMTSSNPKLDFTLGGADILEFSVPFRYEHNENIEFFVEAIFQKQMIIESDVEYDGAYGYYEPESTAYNNYMKFGVQYRF